MNRSDKVLPTGRGPGLTGWAPISNGIRPSVCRSPCPVSLRGPVDDRVVLPTPCRASAQGRRSMQLDASSIIPCEHSPLR
jgi:hypothetical protein